MSVSIYGKIPWRRFLHGIHDMPAPEPTPHIDFDLLRDATSNLLDVSSFIDLFRLHRGGRHPTFSTCREALPTELPDVIDAMAAPAEATGDGDETALVVPPPEVDEVR